MAVWDIFSVISPGIGLGSTIYGLVTSPDNVHDVNPSTQLVQRSSNPTLIEEEIRLNEIVSDAWLKGVIIVLGIAFAINAKMATDGTHIEPIAGWPTNPSVPKKK